MKHRSLRLSEYREFMGRKHIPPHLRFSPDSPDLQSEREIQLRALSVSLRLHFADDPAVVIGYRRPIKWQADGETVIRTPVCWMVRFPNFGLTPQKDTEWEYTIDEAHPAPGWVLECEDPALSPIECHDRAKLYIESGGIGEYFLFSPTLPDHQQIRAFQFKKEEFRRLEQWALLWHSSHLQLDLTMLEGMIRLHDARAGIRIPTLLECLEQRWSEDSKATK
ncbi:MAG TPA: hypothetical protein PLB18_14525 [Acidobacteriota bacterium]|nr:hypothetical protein [Acidobacteriota bacterium]